MSRQHLGLPVVTSRLVHIYRSQGQDVAALSGIDLRIGAGEIVGLLGPSGAGKSTLLSLVAGLFRPSAGQVHVGEHDVGSLEGSQLDRYFATVTSLMLQGARRNLLLGRTPLANVVHAQRAARRMGHPVQEPRLVLDQLGLGAYVSTPVEELAPAARQLAALAAATAPRPSVLLADEPTDRLHPKDRAVVLRELAAINAEYGTTTVVVTHDPQVAAALPRTVTIRDGRIGGEGRSGEEFAVVTADHYLPVPEALHGRLSPGTLVHFVAAGDRIELVRPDPDRRPGRDVESDGAPGGSGSRGGVP